MASEENEIHHFVKTKGSYTNWELKVGVEYRMVLEDGSFVIGEVLDSKQSLWDEAVYYPFKNVRYYGSPYNKADKFNLEIPLDDSLAPEVVFRLHNKRTVAGPVFRMALRDPPESMNKFKARITNEWVMSPEIQEFRQRMATSQHAYGVPKYMKLRDMPSDLFGGARSKRNNKRLKRKRLTKRS